MSETPDNANLESQLDALLSQVEADPPKEAESPDPEPATADSAAGSDAVAGAESALEATADLASKLDAMFEDPAAEAASASESEEAAPDQDASEPAVAEAGTTEVPAAESDAPAPDPGDLAAKLDAALAGTLEEPAEPEPSADVPPEAPEETAEFDGDFEAPEPVATEETPAAEPVAASEPSAESLETPEVPEPAVMPEPQPELEPVAEGEDEAALLAAVEQDVEAEADAALEEAGGGGDFAALADMLGVDAAELAEVPATPEDTPEPAAVEAEAQEPVAESDDLDEAFDGAFASVDDLLAEMDPALAELNADADLIASESAEVETAEAASDPEAVAEEMEFDGSFESVDGLEDQPAVAEPEPVPEPVAAEPEPVAAAPVETDETLDEFDGAFATVDHILADAEVPSTAEAGEDSVVKDSTKGSGGGGDKAKVEISVPSGRQIAEAAVAASKQAAATGQAAAIRIKPHAIQAAKLSYRGLKLGCFHANGSLDTVGGKLAKDEAPPPPLKQYVGIAAMALLVPGVLLVIVGLLT
ncbi:MAG: hypothetical protein AAGF84_08380 [Planctomycetota bacterium]